jgi:hypothetical protein
MIEIGDYKKIMSDRNLFNQVVYTSLPEAVKLLSQRQKNPKLIKKIEKLLEGDIPDFLKKIDKYAVNIQQIATPNFDTQRFISLSKKFNLKPVFSEYHEDKFTSNNLFKHCLGQIYINNGVYKDGRNKLEKITIIDFNKYNGKKLKDVKTLWDEFLIDFHKKLFEINGFSNEELIFFDDSSWLNRNGSSAKKYYPRDLLLYICHGILFENFLLIGKESNFTRDVFLPAFQKVIELTGEKPLIVPISLIETESNEYWYSYDKKIKKYIESKFLE